MPATTRSTAARHGPTRYRRRTPETTVLHRVVREHLATFLATADARAEADPGRASLPHYVRREDVLACPCGARRRVLAMVFDPDAIDRVLQHLGLPTTRPARAPPRPIQQALALA